MTKQLPFSPLTHAELNERHDSAARQAFYYLRACVSGNSISLTDRDETVLLASIRDADAYLEAAWPRCERVSA